METKYPGAKITLGGKEYIMPAMSLRSIKEKVGAINDISAKGGVPTPEDVDVMAELVHTCLKRNYPDIELDFILDSVDMGNVRGLVKQALTGSGLELGNVSPAAPTAEASSGTGSTGN